MIFFLHTVSCAFSHFIHSGVEMMLSYFSMFSFDSTIHKTIHCKIYAQDPLKISSHWFSEQNSILKAYHYELSFISPLTRDVKNSIGIISIINILRQPINFLRVFLTKSVPPEILGAGIGKIHFTHALGLKWYYKSKKLHLQHPSKSNHPKKKQK